MKAALIMDMPKSCHECRFWFAKATDPVRYRCMAAQKITIPVNPCGSVSHYLCENCVKRIYKRIMKFKEEN